MEKTITPSAAKRLERNAKIKERYEKEISVEGSMKSAVISGIAKSYRMTVPTVYSIIKIYNK